MANVYMEHNDGPRWSVEDLAEFPNPDGFTLIQNDSMPPGCFMLVGHEQLVFYKNGKVRVFDGDELRQMYEDAFRHVMDERKQEQPQ